MGTLCGVGRPRKPRSRESSPSKARTLTWDGGPVPQSCSSPRPFIAMQSGHHCPWARTGRPPCHHAGRIHGRTSRTDHIGGGPKQRTGGLWASEFVGDGGLLSYGVDPLAAGRRGLRSARGAPMRDGCPRSCIRFASASPANETGHISRSPSTSLPARSLRLHCGLGPLNWAARQTRDVVAPNIGYPLDMIIRTVKKLISAAVFGCPRLYFFDLPGEQTSSRAALRSGVRPGAAFYFRQVKRAVNRKLA